MPYTMEDFRRDVLKQRLEQMSPEALLKILPTEKLLKALPPEERLKGLPTAVIENYRIYRASMGVERGVGAFLVSAHHARVTGDVSAGYRG